MNSTFHIILVNIHNESIYDMSANSSETFPNISDTFRIGDPVGRDGKGPHVAKVPEAHRHHHAAQQDAEVEPVDAAPLRVDERLERLERHGRRAGSHGPPRRLLADAKLCASRERRRTLERSARSFISRGGAKKT